MDIFAPAAWIACEMRELRGALTVIGACAVLLTMSCTDATERARAVGRVRPAAARPDDRPAAEAGDLLRRSVTVRSYAGTIAGLVDELIDRQKVPLSYVGEPKEPRITIDLESAPLDELLREVLTQAPAFRYERIRGHLVLYPKDALFHRTLRDVRIVGRERSDAANDLVKLLRTRYGEFRDWRGLVTMGDSESPLFTQKVTLPGQGRVIDLLVGLLGDDEALIFTVSWNDAFKGMVMSLGRVTGPPRQGA
jgi:hypothetical protein